MTNMVTFIRETVHCAFSICEALGAEDMEITGRPLEQGCSSEARGRGPLAMCPAGMCPHLNHTYFPGLS